MGCSEKNKRFIMFFYVLMFGLEDDVSRFTPHSSASGLGNISDS
jgi:hypothetical protein